MSKGIIYSWIAYFAFLLFTVINYLIFLLLHLEPRTWLTVLTWLLIVLVPCILLFLMILNSIHICKSSITKGFLTFALVIYSIAALGFLCMLGLWGLFNLEEEKILDDGSILVTEAGFPDPGPSYRCLRVLFFARQPIPGTRETADDRSPDSRSHSDTLPGNTASGDTEADSAGSDSMKSDGTESNSAESDGMRSDGTESDGTESDDTEPDSAESDSPADSSPYVDEPTKAAQMIYDRIFAPQGKKCSFQYDAKGNLYVILDKGSRELNGTTVTTQETLTYDRISKNGKCHLFVYYEEHYDDDGNKLDNTSILNFYAVNLETGEVTAADKTSWSDSGSAEYYEATGEY